MTREPLQSSLELPVELVKHASQLVRTMNLGEVQQFDFAGIPFGFRPTVSINPETNLPNGSAAEFYHNPRAVNDRRMIWTIYIWEDLPEKVQRVLLFHEIVEILFINHYPTKVSKAHEATLPYEENFINLMDLISSERQLLKDLRRK